jgi:similar to stage IV sporulation protein
LLSRLWSFLTGYVTLVIDGKNLEKLINMAVSRGLFLWDVKWIDSGKVAFKVRLNGVNALRHIARRSRSRFKIERRTGLPFYAVRIKKRKMRLVGAILTVVLIYTMFSFIWFVEVKGNKKISADRIIKAAEDVGLAMGTLKFGLNKDKSEKYIRNEISELSWVGIKITGTKAQIQVVEKTLLPPVDNSPANVVAEKEGLISELLVLSGKQVVDEGVMVKKGDLLISGIIPLPQVKYVRAKGIIKAKVWYEGYGESRLIETGTRRTGKEYRMVSLRMLGREVIIRGSQIPPFRDFVTGVKVKKILEWRNIDIPVEIVTTNYYEVRKYRDIIGVFSAKTIAGKKALDDARKKIPADAAIIKEISEEIYTRGYSVMRVKVVLEVLEEIGITKPLEKHRHVEKSQ